jgi:hypothetical protein
MIIVAEYAVIILLPLIIIFLIRWFIQQKKNMPDELFMEALRNENSGQFEKAIVTYERALDEVNKIRFQDSDLKSKIIEKLKVLHTVIEYENGFHYGNGVN